MIRSVLRGTGSALPRNCVTNAQLAERVDTSDNWIVERTGIRQRYIAGEGEPQPFQNFRVGLVSAGRCTEESNQGNLMGESKI